MTGVATASLAYQLMSAYGASGLAAPQRLEPQGDRDGGRGRRTDRAGAGALDLLEGRAHRPHRLSAFFLEDLLAPSKAWNSRGAVRMQRIARCAEADPTHGPLGLGPGLCPRPSAPRPGGPAGDAPCASPTRVRPYGSCARGSGDPTPETGTESVIPPDRSRGSPGRLRERRAFPHYGVLLDPELSNR